METKWGNPLHETPDTRSPVTPRHSRGATINRLFSLLKQRKDRPKFYSPSPVQCLCMSEYFE